jgi:hypothetical protein
MYIEEGARASFRTMAWGLLTNFRVLTGDDFSTIYSDSLATLDNTKDKEYTFFVGWSLVIWHLFAYVVLQAALLAYTLEYFSFSSWQHHWHRRPLLAGLDVLVFETVFGDGGRIQKFMDRLLAKVSVWYFHISLNFARHRIEPIQEAEAEQLPSIHSQGEDTPAIQSWWKNTPVISSSPMAQGGDGSVVPELGALSPRERERLRRGERKRAREREREGDRGREGERGRERERDKERERERASQRRGETVGRQVPLSPEH